MDIASAKQQESNLQMLLAMQELDLQQRRKQNQLHSSRHQHFQDSLFTMAK